MTATAAGSRTDGPARNFGIQMATVVSTLPWMASRTPKARNAGPFQMPHMPDTGISGLTLYGQHVERLRPWATAVPTGAGAVCQAAFFSGLSPAMRELRLYLPLYNALSELSLGFSPLCAI